MPAPRPLYIYRRHTDDCGVHEIEKLDVRAKKMYKACDCPIWMTGNNAKGEFVPRQQTGLRDWDAAEALLAEENKNAAARVQHGDDGITINQAIHEKFLKRHASKTGPKAHSQHELVLTRFEAFAKGQGVTFAQGITYDLCVDFVTYGVPGIEEVTRNQYRSKLKVFLKEAFKSKWIKENIAPMIDNVHADREQTEPYSDDEVTAILDEAGRMNGGTVGYASKPKTFRLLLEVMLETGMRVSDAVRYNPAQLVKSSKKTGLWKYTFTPRKQKKTAKKKQVVTFMSDQLKLAIDQADFLSKRLPFAYDLNALETDKHERSVYERMQAIGQRIDVADCRPHRCRDTFAVNHLQKGMALDDLSKLLGHSSVRVTEEYYAKWTTGREDRLELVFCQTL